MIKIKTSWSDFLENEFKQDYFKKLWSNVLKHKNDICPNLENIFKCFELCAKSKCSIIIFGQDPYSTPGLADGLCFSINENSSKIPPSLKNIFIELKNDIGIQRNNYQLYDWAKQGILMINTLLTVLKNQPMSCKGWGWEIFIDHFLEYIHNIDKKYIFVLLGQQAQKYICKINIKKDYIIKTSHPSSMGMSCYKGFFGSKIFSKINLLLKELNKDEINW